MQQGAFNIFEAFLASNNALSFVGFLPFRVDAKRKAVLKRSVYFTAFFLSLYSAALLALCILGEQEPDAEESRLVRHGYFALYLQFMSTAILVVLFNYVKRHELANCLLAMHHFDCSVEVGQMR